MSDDGGRAWRVFEVVRKEAESATITSLYLAPSDRGPLAAFAPGQFLTLRLPIGPDGVDVLRTYSISSSPDEKRFYRISVKREPAPAPGPAGSGVPPGLVSNHLHDGVAVGERIAILPPRGEFVLDQDSQRPVLLISGGVGLTPLVAMAHQLAAEGSRPTWFIHACVNRLAHAFRAEMADLAARSPNLRRYICYEKADAADRTAGACDAEGRLTAQMLQSFLPIDDYECYLCGPPGFMQAMYVTLIRLGVRQMRIHYEFFGPATVLRSGDATEAPATAAGPSLGMAMAASAVEPRVTFARSGRSVIWADRYVSILELAEANGLTPDFSCRAGVCSTCRCGLRSGTVAYTEEPLAEPGEGSVLICCSRPESDIVLDL